MEGDDQQSQIIQMLSQRRTTPVQAMRFDAAFLAVKQITGVEMSCKEFHVRSTSLGYDAPGEITLEAEHAGQIYRGRAISTDCVEASIKAVLNAANRILAANRK